jgi:hypothetical protein
MFTSEDYHFEEKLTGVQAKSLVVYLTPENIIKGKFILFDANIFNEIDSFKEYYDKDITGMLFGKQALRKVIAGWYYALVDFSIVALLSVLVYAGIRMTISTISKDKAKYKVMFKDWFVAICLLVLMNYIMIAMLTITSKITDAIGSSGTAVDLIGQSTEIITGVLNNDDYKYGEYTMGDMYGHVILLRWSTYIYIYFCMEIPKKRIYNNIFNIIRTCIMYNIPNR